MPDKRLTNANASATGDDGLAPFHMWGLDRWLEVARSDAEMEPFKCQNCETPCNTVIRYSNAKATGIVAALKRFGIEPPFTRLILKHPNDVLGVDCGCYGRFQRQIAHIRGNVFGSTKRKRVGG